MHFLLGNRPEASAVLILHDVGKIVSDLVLASTHKSLTKQTDFIPDRASVVNMQGEERQVTPGEIKKGDFVLVRSGERIPIDGIVLRGEGTVDDTVLTGENEPVPVAKNAKVLAGSSIHRIASCCCGLCARFDDCAVNQILRVQEEGKEKKAALGRQCGARRCADHSGHHRSGSAAVDHSAALQFRHFHGRTGFTVH